MAQRLTLQQLRDNVGFAADVSIQASGRYPNAMIDLWINQAIQTVQLLKCEYDVGDRSMTSIVGTATDSAAPGGYLAREVLTLPNDFLTMLSIYVHNGQIRNQLRLLDLSDRALDPVGQNMQPLYYAILDPGQSVEARVRLWPPADQAYTYEVTYCAEYPTLVSVGDTWDFAPGTEDLVICAVAKRILDRDGVPEPQQYQALDKRYNDAKAMLAKFARRNGGVATVRNTRALNELAAYRGRRLV